MIDNHPSAHCERISGNIAAEGLCEIYSHPRMPFLLRTELVHLPNGKTPFAPRLRMWNSRWCFTTGFNMMTEEFRKRKAYIRGDLAACEEDIAVALLLFSGHKWSPK